MQNIEKNLNNFEIDNVELINADLTDEISKEKNIDLLFLDMPDPNPILSGDLKSVKNGSYVVCYVPSISQIQEITKTIAASEYNLYLEEITEVINREWKVWERISRPMHRKEIDHTAFLVFIRKI